MLLKQTNQLQLTLFVLLIYHQLHPQLQVKIKLNLILDYLLRHTIKRTVHRPVNNYVRIPPWYIPKQQTEIKQVLIFENQQQIKYHSRNQNWKQNKNIQ